MCRSYCTCVTSGESAVCHTRGLRTRLCLCSLSAKTKLIISVVHLSSASSNKREEKKKTKLTEIWVRGFSSTPCCDVTSCWGFSFFHGLQQGGAFEEERLLRLWYTRNVNNVPDIAMVAQRSKNTHPPLPKKKKKMKVDVNVLLSTFSGHMGAPFFSTWEILYCLSAVL